MLLVDLYENFRVLTRDDRANWTTHGLDEIMDDVSGEKTILKQSPSVRDPTPTLTVYPFISEHNQPGFFIEIFSDNARMRETYSGEAIPVLQFLLSRWPAYGDIQEEDTGSTLAEIAKSPRQRLSDQQQWFHGTTSRHLPDIMRLGLMPRDVSQRNYRGLGGSEEGLVYLGADEEAAQMHATNAAKQFGGAPVVLQIDISGMENRMVNDHDVRHTALGTNDPFDRAVDGNDRTIQRIRRNPGEASYLTIGTVSFRGRIPPNRIKVVWQGKEKKGRTDTKSDMYSFVNQLAALAKQLNPGTRDARGTLYDFFRIIGVSPGGWSGGQVTYPDQYYSEPEKTLNSVFTRRSQPARFAKWVHGMHIRAHKFRRRTQMNISTQQEAAIVRLIDAMDAKLAR